MPRHKKKKRAAAKPAASVKKRDWLVGDLVVAKLRGHRPWPAQIQKPEDYGYDARPHRIFVTFYGTEETCFCSYNKITPFTSAVRKNLAEQLQKINTNPELERAIKEIFAADDELRVSSKSLGSNQKEDDEMASEKSEEEEPPVERSRKRARVVEEAVVPVAVVDERPAKQEKTVKSMAAEQVQKLPRKVRIKVSTQGSDLPTTPQQGSSLPGSDKAGVSSSQASQRDGPPLRTSEPADSAKTPVKTSDRTTTDKLDDSVNLKENENVVVDESERHASENGGDAAEKTQEDHATTGSATAKTDNDGAEQMEVDDDKAVVSETSERAVGKEDDDDKSLATKASETAIENEDDSSALKQPVTLEITADEVEKMEVDDEEKSLASKTNCEPTIGKEEDASTVGKEDDSSTAKESVVTAEDRVEKMEVEEDKTETGKPAIGKEDESVKGDPAGKMVEASNVSSKNESVQGNDSSVAAKGHDPQTVEDMETSRAGQEQQFAPGAKEGVVNNPSKSQDSQRESVAKVEREDDGLGLKASSASTEPDALDEAAKSSPSKDPVSASKEEDLGEKKHGAEETQIEGDIEKKKHGAEETQIEEDIGEKKHGAEETQNLSLSATKDDDAASRIDVQDGAVPGQSSRKLTDKGEKVPDSEAQASRLNEAGAVDRTEDQDGATVEKVEHQNDEAVKKGEDQEAAAVKEREEQDRAEEKLEDQVTGAKKLEGPGVAEIEKTEDQGTEVKKTEDKDVEMKTDDQDVEVKKTEDKDVEMKTDDQDVEVKKTEDQGAEVQQSTDDKVAALKAVLGKGSSVKRTTPQIVSGESGVPTPALEKGVALPQTVTENTVASTSEKTVDPTPVQQESVTPQIGTGNGEVLSTRKQEGGTPQLSAVDVVELSTPAKQDAAVDEKRTDSSKGQPTTES